MPSWKRRAWLPVGAAYALLCGCGAGSLGSYDGSDAGDSAWHGSESDTAPDEASPVADMPRARGGIEIDRVEANQGVAVVMGRQGRAVEPAERAAPLIKDRVTLVRAFWSLPDVWEPRDIEGRLTVTYPDGSEEVFSHTTMVDAEAMDGELGRSFFWGLTADQTRPGLEFAVELLETSHEYGDLAEPSPRARLPEDGRASMDVRPGDQRIKVVVVPFAYDDGAGCATTPDTSPSTMRRFTDALYMQNPLSRVDFTLHEPVPWTTPLSSFVPLNVYLSGLRFDEGAPPETYYYGLIDVCADGLGNAGGMAIAIPEDPVNESSAALRVASGLSRTPSWSAETFVHELGHSQGRAHVACNGDEGGPNPLYPHEGGDLGEWGFGVVDFGLRNPSAHKDYMTYCHPAWVGTWGWNEVYPVIEGLSAWATAAQEDSSGPDALAPLDEPYEGSLLIGAIEPDGREHWITVPGSLPVAFPDGTVRIEHYQGAQRLASIPAHVQAMQDGDGGTLVIAPLPERWSSVTEVAWIDQGVRTTVPRASIGEHHRHRFIRR